MTRQIGVKVGWLLEVGFLLACAQVWAQELLAGVRTVSNASESGPGSLRQAILDANAHVGPDLIRFDIPQTDPGFVAYVDDDAAGEFDPYAGVVSAWDPLADPDSPRWWQVGLVEAGLPPLSDDETSVDGTTQTANQGNSNSYGPEIQIINQSGNFMAGFGIESNFIGTDPSGTYNLGVYGAAIWISQSLDNRVGPGNVIFDGDIGVHVEGEASVGNVITQNRISHNEDAGIRLTQGGNNQMSAPFIRDAYTNAVWGVAVPGALVELFSDAADEGEIYAGKVVAGPDGSFAWFGALTGPMVTATATDQAGNTSQFSLPAPMNGAASWLFLPLWVKWE